MDKKGWMKEMLAKAMEGRSDGGWPSWATCSFSWTQLLGSCRY